MKVIGILAVTAVFGLGACASPDLRAEASQHCAANVSSRVLASDCDVASVRSGRSVGKVQQRNPAIDAALRNGA